jgi:hypothetical protein
MPREIAVPPGKVQKQSVLSICLPHSLRIFTTITHFNKSFHKLVCPVKSSMHRKHLICTVSDMLVRFSQTDIPIIKFHYHFEREQP